MKKVLFSYSSQDGHKVYRIYEDLVRSGFQTWRFEVDGVKGTNFESHYKSILQNEVDVLIYCDSANARNSEYVQRECEWAFEAKEDENSPLKEILVCVCDPINGEWRTQSPKLFDENLKKKILGTNSFQFFDPDIDGDSYIYFSEIEKLIEHLGGIYRPWSSLPRDKDFEQEIQAARNSAIPLNQRDALLAGYRYLRVSSMENWSGTLKKWEQFISDCRFLFNEKCRGSDLPNSGMPLIPISAFLATARFAYLNKEYAISERYSREMIELFPKDARAEKALANTLYDQRKYDEAYESFRSTKEKAENSELVQHQEQMYEVNFNLIQSALSINQISEAKELVNSCFSDSQDKLIELELVKFFILVSEKKWEELQKHYVTSIIPILKTGEFSSEQQKILAEVESSYAKMLIEEVQDFELDQILPHFEKAHILDPERIKYGAELAMLYLLRRKSDEYQCMYRKFIDRKPRTTEEHYYMGHLFFFRGDQESSRYHFDQSKGEIDEWYAGIL